MRNSSAEVSAPRTSTAETTMRDLLGTALSMLELIASRMPQGAAVRIAIESECAAMRSAARAALSKGA